jgi:hypothetical protein
VGFSASPPLAALGGALGSSAISVDAYEKASLYGQQKHEFCHIADKHVNREKRRQVSEKCREASHSSERMENGKPRSVQF